MKNKVVTNYVKNNKFKMIIMLVVLLFIFLFFIFSHLWHSEKQNKNQEMLLKEQEQITQMVDYLNKIDATIYDNKEDLAEVALNKEEREQILNTFLELLSNLEKELIQNGNIIETYRESQIIGNSEMLSFFDILLEKQKEIQVQIMKVNTEIVAILSDLREESENKYSLLFERIEKVQTALLKAEKSTKNYYSDLTELILLLQEENQDRNKELLESLILMQENISHLLNHNFSEIKMQLDEEFTMLIEKMNALHQQIDITGNAIAELCILLEENNENRQEEINVAFISVKALLGQIKEDYHNAYTQIQNLIQKLQADENVNHNETLSVLTLMENNMKENSMRNLTSITNSLQLVKENFSEYITNLQGEMTQNITDLNTGIYNTISQNNSNMMNCINQLNEDITKQYQELYITVNNNDTSQQESLDNLKNILLNRLQEVFQSVSSGKQKCASALLTKGIDIKSDATFEEIYQAILAIPQQLVIGVQEIPGMINYEYHFHEDGTGNQPHSEKIIESGGCYTVPYYHAHEGTPSKNGGCYTIPVYHNHSSGCYREVGSPEYGCYTIRSWDTSEGDWAGHDYKYYEMSCGRTIHGTNSYHTHNVLSCSQGGNIVRYSVGCGKNEHIIEGYCPNCGLSDGQIIGALIIYDKNEVHSMPNIIFKSEEDIEDQKEQIPTISGNIAIPEVNHNSR